MDPRDWKKNKEPELDFDPFKLGAVTEDHDPMQLHLQKSIIASTLSGARATLNEPSRPFTPADLPRHLFSGNDYSERPGSAYKVGQVASDALENFTRSSTAESNTKGMKPRPNSRSRKKPILEPIVRKKEPAKKNKIVLKKAVDSEAGPKALNTFKSNKPVKVVKMPVAEVVPPAQQELHVEGLNLDDCEIGNKQMQKNRDDAIKKQQELIESMKKAKQDYDLNIEDADEDDMENYFLDNLSSELVTESNPPQQDKYVEALTKLEEIKKNQHEEEHKFTTSKHPIEEDSDEPDDDMEERLMKDIHQSMKQETGQLDEDDADHNKTEFEAEYASLIEEFQKFSRRLKPNIQKVSEISDRVWRLIDEWRNQDQSIIEN